MSTVVIIPARGGSKRIPRKNVRPFAGKPMITWSIETALASNAFDTVLVSTDDPQIADLARKNGAWVPFLRPADLADDHTGTKAVVAHAVRWLHQNGHEPALTGCLYPTAPFAGVTDIHAAFGALSNDPTAEIAMTVGTFRNPIWRALGLRDDGRLERIFPEHQMTRSQDLPTAYYDAGQFYLAKSYRWLDPDLPLSTGAVPIHLPPHRAIDIDDMDDWRWAELLFAALGKDDDAADTVTHE